MAARAGPRSMTPGSVFKPPAEVKAFSRRANITRSTLDRQLGKRRHVSSQIRTQKHRQLVSRFACSAEGVYALEGPDETGSPPFVVKFSQVLLDGAMLAICDEEGFVTLIDSRKPVGEAGVSAKWEAHLNSIFDLEWVDDDTKVATASGDQTASIFDVEYQSIVALFRGHNGSVKSIRVKPHHKDIFATGFRDGNVCIWDKRCCRETRCLENGESFDHDMDYITPCITMRNIHTISSLPVRASKRTMLQNPNGNSQQSVTAVEFLNGGNILASAGAADGMVKLWDLRKYDQRTPRELYSLFPKDQASCLYQDRKFGISALAVDSTGARLLASSIDNKIHCYDIMRMENSPSRIYDGHLNSSFYVKLTFSPCDEFILSGSSDSNVYIWERKHPERTPFVLSGHQGEVSGVTWCPTDFTTIASCADDVTVRMWKASMDGPEPENKAMASDTLVRRRLFESPGAGNPNIPLPTPSRTPSRTPGRTPVPPRRMRQPHINEIWSPPGRLPLSQQETSSTSTSTRPMQASADIGDIGDRVDRV